ncbi:helix-turn-helix domain-containing protein [Carnobacterium sp. TMP28]|uniref:TetR/AcrR family transcriptional regulator n=1 Tax=Carnobacterium sp. TMP28 TaxID=3397060 RepID=UPI0039E14E7B
MGRKKTYETYLVLLKMGEIFIERGYEATSLDDLERETGLLRGSLYREFGSKRTMFELTLKEYLKRKPNSNMTLDLLLIGFQELSARDRSLRTFLKEWYDSQCNSSVSESLGNRLIERSKILDESE